MSKKIPARWELARLSEPQRRQIWKQVDYHLHATPIEKLDLGDRELVFEIATGVTRPMSSKMLARWLWDHGEQVLDRVVLDMGTGCGIQGIVAAVAGARRSDMVDIMPEAVRCARDNALLLGVADKCQFQVSDLFECLAGDTKYDVIVFAQPLFSDDPIAVYKCTIGMLNHRKLINDYFDEASKYLNRDGRVVMLAWNFASEENNPIYVGPERGWEIETTDIVHAEGGLQEGQMEIVVLRPRLR